MLIGIAIECFGKRGACMVGNMAATDPGESPEPAPVTSEVVEKSGEINESTSEGAVHNVHDTSPRNAKENPDDTQGETLAKDDEFCVSHSEVSGESGGGTSQATRKSADEQKPVEKMKEAPTDEQRAFDGGEMQENDGEETKTQRQETGMQTCYDVLHH